MEIMEFVPLAKVDPVYFDKGYYLSPGKGGDKAYGLLAKAMTETGRCGLAKYAARGKQYLVVVRPVTGHEDGLMMQQLNYADEVRSFADVEVPHVDVKDAELKLAIMLTDQIATDEFHPENYKDEVKERVEGLIRWKIDGEEISETKPEGYAARDAAAMLGVSLARVTAWAEWMDLEVSPALRFGFHDLVLLRTAKGLAEAKVPAATVRRALKKLRGQLPEDRPLTGVRIAADGRRVVVQDGAAAWNPESGQTLFDFAMADIATAAAPLATRIAAPSSWSRITQMRT
jgi:hypothetical protein